MQANTFLCPLSEDIFVLSVNICNLKRMSLLSKCSVGEKEKVHICVLLFILRTKHPQQETNVRYSDECLDLYSRESKQPLEASGAALESHTIRTRCSRTLPLAFVSIRLHSSQVALKIYICGFALLV